MENMEVAFLQELLLEDTSKEYLLTKKSSFDDPYWKSNYVTPPVEGWNLYFQEIVDYYSSFSYTIPTNLFGIGEQHNFPLVTHRS